MLVLTRHEGESILIGDDIRITIVDIRGTGGVRIGIDAPQHKRIMREELLKEELTDGTDCVRH